MAELFGFSITKLKQKADPKQSFTTSQADDGTQTYRQEDTLVLIWIWKVLRRRNKTLFVDIEK